MILKEIICAIRGHLPGVIHEHITITFSGGRHSNAIICTCRRCKTVVVLQDAKADVLFIPEQGTLQPAERRYVQ